MKKAFILFFALITLMVGCSNTSNGYKYADKWNPTTTDFGGYVPTKDFYSHTVESDNTEMMDLKNELSRFFKSYDLDWDNFAKVTVVKEISIKTKEDAEDITPETFTMIYGYFSMYDDDTKEVYLFPLYFECSEDLKRHALAHELIHALISTDHKNYGRLEEGVVDLYTNFFMKKSGYTPQPAYIAELNVANWLVAVFGETEVIRATREGNLHSLIDEASKAGMGAKLDAALSAFYQSEDLKTLTEIANVIYDILVHLANQSKAENMMPLLEFAKTNYASIGVDLDMQYLKNFLY